MVQLKCLKKHQCTETVNFTGFNNHDLNPHIYLHFDLWKQTKESFHLAEHQRIYRLICEGPVFWSGSESEMLHSYMMFTVLLVLGDLGWSAIWLEQKPPVLILIPDSALCGQSPSVLNQRGQETWLHAPQEEDQEASWDQEAAWQVQTFSVCYMAEVSPTTQPHPSAAHIQTLIRL